MRRVSISWPATAALLAPRGLAIANLDVTIVLERPKLRPYIEAMRRAIAGALDSTCRA